MKLEGQFPFSARHKVFLSSYKIKLTFKNGATGLIGRGSTGILGHLNVYQGQETRFPLIEVGNFCESAEASLILDGEHNNAKIMNSTFGSLPVAREILARNGIQAWRSSAQQTLKIGHAVTLSKGCTILTGSSIGNGAVIGANAVVKGTISPYSIAIGSPARELRKRISTEQIQMVEELRWWDFEINHLLQNLPLLNDIEANFSVLKRGARYDETKNLVVVTYDKEPTVAASMKLKVIGWETNGQYCDINQNTALNQYFHQLYEPESKMLT